MCTCGSPFPRGWDEARPGQERSSPNTQGSRPWLWTRIVDRIVARSWHSPSPDPLRAQTLRKPGWVPLCKLEGRPDRLATATRSRRACTGRPTEVCIRLTTPKRHDGQARPAAGPRVVSQSSGHDRALTTRIERNLAQRVAAGRDKGRAQDAAYVRILQVGALLGRWLTA